jgi:hypothetical protein
LDEHDKKPTSEHGIGFEATTKPANAAEHARHAVLVNAALCRCIDQCFLERLGNRQRHVHLTRDS